MTTAAGATNFGFSQDGSLVYVSGGHTVGLRWVLVWVDAEGREEPLGVRPAAYTTLRLSPDGTRVATSITEQGNLDVWIGELARGTLSRLTTHPAWDSNPIWTPDGQRVVFASGRDGQFGLFWRAADGTGAVENLVIRETVTRPSSWSRDGKTLVVDYSSSELETNIGALSLEGDRTLRALLETDAGESLPAISPDGAWIAYQSDQTGQPEVYVERFPDLGDRQQISTGGGTMPIWSPDGTELFYRRPRDGAMMVVRGTTEPSFTPDPPEVMFEGQYGRSYDVAPDGQRFLMAKRLEDDTSAPSQIIIVQNWFDELQRLVPTN